MLAFTNNSGPLFIVATVGISLFNNTIIGVLLLITHILSSITVGFLFRFWKNKNNSIHKQTFFYKQDFKQLSFSNLGEILNNSIISSIKTVLIICGFVVLFSVVLSILNNSNIIKIVSKIIHPFLIFLNIKDISFANGIISGLIELTNGVLIISNIPCKQISTNIIICAFLLGFGGLSVLFQVYSIISKSSISIKPYLIGKLLHGVLAGIYTYFFIVLIPIFNLNL